MRQAQSAQRCNKPAFALDTLFVASCTSDAVEVVVADEFAAALRRLAAPAFLLPSRRGDLHGLVFAGPILGLQRRFPTKGLQNMKTTTQRRNQTIAFERAQLRLVVYCEGSIDESALRFLSRISTLSQADVHFIGGSDGWFEKQPTVEVRRPVGSLRSREYRLSVSKTQSAQALLAKCGRGKVDEVVARYCKRLAANLVIVPLRLDHRGLWSVGLAERLGRSFPVLAVPAGQGSDSIGESRARLRWLVPLEGSKVAEAILGPLSSLTTWLPSDITLIQPLPFAKLWRHRFAQNEWDSPSTIEPSIFDSQDYLTRSLHRNFSDSPLRVCCAIDSDGVAAIVRLANSPAIDAVAIGLSNNWPISRFLTGELNELILRQVRKPVLLFEPGSH